MTDSYHNARRGGISDGTVEGQRGAYEHGVAKRQLEAQKQLFSGQQQVNAQNAGRELGDGLMAIVVGLFLHPVFSFVGFWLICTLLLLLLGSAVATVLGLGMNSPPSWFFFSGMTISAALTVVLRKFVPRLMRWTFILLCGALALAIVAAIVTGIMESSAFD